MSRFRRIMQLVIGASLLAGCETSESVETEIMISEMQAQIAELEAQLDFAYTEMSQLSSELTTRVANMEMALDDVNRRVLDLQAGIDQAQAIREVEAAVAIARQRMEAVRITTNNFASTLE